MSFSAAAPVKDLPSWRLSRERGIEEPPKGDALDRATLYLLRFLRESRKAVGLVPHKPCARRRSLTNEAVFAR
jgi:hypothetical protein